MWMWVKEGMRNIVQANQQTATKKEQSEKEHNQLGNKAKHLMGPCYRTDRGGGSE